VADGVVDCRGSGVMTLENGFSWDRDASPARGHLIIAEACLGASPEPIIRGYVDATIFYMNLQAA
jgi:hypothetical protein